LLLPRHTVGKYLLQGESGRLLIILYAVDDANAPMLQTQIRFIHTFVSPYFFTTQYSFKGQPVPTAKALIQAFTQ
jgi:hypothetical protein